MEASTLRGFLRSLGITDFFTDMSLEELLHIVIDVPLDDDGFVEKKVADFSLR